MKLFSPLLYENKVKVTSKEVKNFFDGNGSRFVIPATYDIDFIVLEGDEKVDEIGNLLYEENSSLDPVAEKFNLKVERITRLDLNAPAIGGGKLNNNALRALNDAKFRSELFSDDFLKENYKPICNTCNCPLTVKHFLSDCTIFETSRQKLLNATPFLEISKNLSTHVETPGNKDFFV